jgi:urease accessory protein
MRSAPPLSLRETPEGLHLVASAAGPLGGDDVRLAVSVTEGASLTVRTAAAQLALPGPRPGPSFARVTADIAADATLRWLPEPLVLVASCDHRSDVTLTLAAGASVVWREEVVLGRAGEVTGSLLHRLRVDRAGRPLLRNDLVLGPRWPGAGGPAGCGDARVVGTSLVVGDAARILRLRRVEGVRAAACRLAEDAVLITALAPSHEGLHDLLTRSIDGASPLATDPC